MLLLLGLAETIRLPPLLVLTVLENGNNKPVVVDDDNDDTSSATSRGINVRRYNKFIEKK